MHAGFGRTEDGWRWATGRGADFDFGDFIGLFGGRRGRPGGGWGGRRGRMFDQGDLRLVVLRLLAEKPRHGYEIIRALEEQSGGTYSPSPGAVYPTLQLLEELGHARAVDEGNGRRIFEITDAGRAYLTEHQRDADDIFDRVAGAAREAGAGAEAFGELAGTFGSLGRAAFRSASRTRGDREKLRAIRQILERAEHDIEALG